MEMNTPTRVVHITTVHNPFDTRIFRKQCQSLAQAGYDVTLVTPHSESTIVDGVRIHALPEPPTRLHRMTATAVNAYRVSLNLDADIYHIHDPELIPVGLALKASGHTVIRDIHEDVAMDVETKYWLPSAVRAPIARLIRLLETSTAQLFDHLIAATPAIAELFPSDRTDVVQNFPIREELFPGETEVSTTDGAPVIAYVGNLTRIRGAIPMIQAMNQVRRDDAVLEFAGMFSPESLEEAAKAEAGFESVRPLGWQTREEVAQLLGRARAGLVTFLPAPNHIRAQPNKLFEYMSAGIPVIASDFPLWREIISRHNSGILVNPEDPASIARAIDWVIEHPAQAREMGQRGRQAVQDEYNWKSEFAVLQNVYTQLTQ